MEQVHWVRHRCQQLLSDGRRGYDAPPRHPKAPLDGPPYSPRGGGRQRTIWARHGPHQDDYQAVCKSYQGNGIRTTKYSLLTFIPMNLFQQFHRAANLYFLFLVLLNWVPVVEAFQKEITMIPLLLVLSAIAFKDALEDYRRYRCDKKLNHRSVHVYCGKQKTYVDQRWRDVRVGDFVRLSCNEIIPADLVLLQSSDPHGVCYIETANLDGETNLKQRQVVADLPHQGGELTPESFHSRIQCENPNADLSRFRGYMEHPSKVRVGLHSNNLLLRSCIVRNTASVVGIVVYAGHDTKAMQNNSGPRYKTSHLEHRLNVDVLWSVALLLGMCLTAAIGHGIWLKQLKDPVFLIADGISPALAGFYVFWTMIIVLQVLIPISLYVSIEIVKLGQVFFIQNDLDLYNEQLDSRIHCRALNITEDLGQIQYLFSDKTGTLTENKMVFRRCTIYGVEYPHYDNARRLEVYEAEDAELPERSATLRSHCSAKSLSCRSLSCHQPSLPLHHQGESDGEEEDGNSVAAQLRTSAFSSRMAKDVVPDPQLVKRLDCLSSLALSPGDVGPGRPSLEVTYIMDFFLALAVCNSVVVSSPSAREHVVQVPEMRTPLTSLEDMKLMFQRFNLARFSPLSALSLPQTSDSPNSFTRRVLSWPKASASTTCTASNSTQCTASSSTQCTVSSSTQCTASSSTQCTASSSTQCTANSSAQCTASCSTQCTANSSTQCTASSSTPHTASSSTPHTTSSSMPHTAGSSTPHTASSSMPCTASTVVLSSAGQEQEADLGPEAQWEDCGALVQGGVGPLEGVGAPVGGVGACAEPVDPEILYEAESPDEAALVHAARAYGCVLHHRSADRVLVELPGVGRLDIPLLHVLPFDSTRKRMSVVVRHPLSGQAVVYTKGADSVVMELAHTCTDSEQNGHALAQIREQTQSHLDRYASEGLRTLCIAKKVLEEEEYELWLKKHLFAETSIDNREALLLESAERLETNLTVLGATGIVDRLQEDVPETIQALQRAGIRVWVLTGDKQETAINIACACKLLQPSHRLLTANCGSRDECAALLQELREEVEEAERSRVEEAEHGAVEVDETGDFLLVINGRTLDWALQEELQADLMALCLRCRAVICCRSTPLQKSRVVRLVRDHLHGMTLAIGDGANDVSMIQVADVGVGISGQEGMQAVMSSDFAISRFKHLQKLLLVHGSWCSSRLANMVLYFFYKNVMYVNLLFWYQFFCGFSGSVMTNSWILIFFNLLFTSAPPLVYGVLDCPVSADTLMERPELYRSGQHSKVYVQLIFWANILDAFYQSLVCFFVPYLAHADSDIDLLSFGSPINASALLIILLHQVIESHTLTWLHAVVLLGSAVFYFVFTLLFGLSCVTCSPPTNPLGVEPRQMGHPLFYLVCVLTTVTALLPRVLFRALANTLRPSAVWSAAQMDRVAPGLPSRRREHRSHAQVESRKLAVCMDNPVLEPGPDAVLS